MTGTVTKYQSISNTNIEQESLEMFVITSEPQPETSTLTMTSTIVHCYQKGGRILTHFPFDKTQHIILFVGTLKQLENVNREDRFFRHISF